MRLDYSPNGNIFPVANLGRGFFDYFCVNLGCAGSQFGTGLF